MEGFKVRRLERRNGTYEAEIEYAGKTLSYEITTFNCTLSLLDRADGFSVFTRDSVQIPKPDEVDIEVRGVGVEARLLQSELQRELREFAVQE